MKQIQLLTASSTDAGEFRDGGSILTVGAKGDVSADRAAELVGAGQAVEFKGDGKADTGADAKVDGAAESVAAE